MRAWHSRHLVKHCQKGDALFGVCQPSVKFILDFSSNLSLCSTTPLDIMCSYHCWVRVQSWLKYVLSPEPWLVVLNTSRGSLYDYHVIKMPISCGS